MFDRIFLLFVFGAGLVIMVWGMALHFSKDVTYKRRWFPYLVVYQQGLMLLMILMPLGFGSVLRVEQLVGMAVFVPLIAWGCYLQIKHTKFCDRCGGWVTTNGFFTSFPGRCGQCGTYIATKPEPPDNSLE